eukprot:6500295-Prymnesium_polylepis.3
MGIPYCQPYTVLAKLVYCGPACAWGGGYLVACASWCAALTARRVRGDPPSCAVRSDVCFRVDNIYTVKRTGPRGRLAPGQRRVPVR